MGVFVGNDSTGKCTHKPIWVNTQKTQKLSMSQIQQAWCSRQQRMSLKAMFIHFRTFHFKFMLSCNFVFCTFHVHNSFVYHHRMCVHIYVHNVYIYGVWAGHSVHNFTMYMWQFQVYVIPRKITYKYYQHQCAATQASIHICMPITASRIGCTLWPQITF